MWRGIANNVTSAQNCSFSIHSFPSEKIKTILRVKLCSFCIHAPDSKQQTDKQTAKHKQNKHTILYLLNLPALDLAVGGALEPAAELPGHADPALHRPLACVNSAHLWIKKYKHKHQYIICCKNWWLEITTFTVVVLTTHRNCKRSKTQCSLYFTGVQKKRILKCVRTVRVESTAQTPSSSSGAGGIALGRRRQRQVGRAVLIGVDVLGAQFLQFGCQASGGADQQGHLALGVHSGGHAASAGAARLALTAFHLTITITVEMEIVVSKHKINVTAL